jgi:hypothetical protein
MSIPSLRSSRSNAIQCTRQRGDTVHKATKLMRLELTYFQRNVTLGLHYPCKYDKTRNKEGVGKPHRSGVYLRSRANHILSKPRSTRARPICNHKKCARDMHSALPQKMPSACRILETTKNNLVSSDLNIIALQDAIRNKSTRYIYKASMGAHLTFTMCGCDMGRCCIITATFHWIMYALYAQSLTDLAQVTTSQDKMLHIHAFQAAECVSRLISRASLVCKFILRC